MLLLGRGKRERMRRIAITNQKGGSGKTTTAVNLAAALGEQRRRVLVIDLDPQCSATSWFGLKNTDKGVFRIFTENGSILDIISNTNVPGVEVVPASPWLVGVEKALAREVGAETILRRQLQSLPHDRWDYLLIDCPPALGILTINALVAVREVLVPVEAHVLALEGLAQLLQTVAVVKERLNPDLEISGILACRVDGRLGTRKKWSSSCRAVSGTLSTILSFGKTSVWRSAPSFGKPITQYDPRSYGAADYRALAREIIRQERGRE
jgi:chromosome partitioning protein